MKLAYVAIIVTGMAGACKGGTEPPFTGVALFFTVQPSSTTAGARIAAAVAIQDASGKVVTRATNPVTVALGANPGGGTLSGATTVNAVNGVATFSGLSIDKCGVGYTFTATASGLVGTSTAFSVTGCWSSKVAMPTPRSGLAVGVVNDVLYAVGGFGQGVGGFTVFGAVEAFDPSANRWTTKASLPTPRAGLAVGVVGSILYAVGGSDSGYVLTVEAYDPSTNSWTTMASMPTPRSDLAVGVVNGILYAVGGNTGNIYLGTVEAYSP